MFLFLNLLFASANEKRYPPKPNDEVYRLEEIANDGTYHRRLKNAKIYTVEDFLKALNKDADDLRVRVKILGLELLSFYTCNIFTAMLNIAANS